MKRRASAIVKRPAFIVAGGFFLLILVGTGVLCLPFTHAEGVDTNFLTSLFTATSAVCLTGLIVVDTATYWSHAGQAVIIALIQLGGLGIMTLTVMVSWLVMGKVGLKNTLTTTKEGRASHLGEVRSIVGAIVGITMAVEVVTAILLAARWARAYDFEPGQSMWHGFFHAISAFNNAGFSLNSDSMESYESDPFILVPLSFAIIAGGLGFYILVGRAKGIRTLSGWFTVWGTILLLVVGTVGIHAFESESWLSSFFQSASTRTAGFNSLNMESIHPGSIVLMELLMAIGGGSGGTAGGVRITTVAVILAVINAEVRGREEVDVRRKRIPSATVRQALTVVVLSLIMVIIGTIGMTVVAPHYGMEKITFEVVSAFSTTGLSLGITSDLPAAAQLIVIVLMFAGRVGPTTVVAALASQKRSHLSYPKERPVIG